MLSDVNRFTRIDVHFLGDEDEAMESCSHGSARHEGPDAAIKGLIEDAHVGGPDFVFLFNDVPVLVSAVVDPVFIPDAQLRETSEDRFVVSGGPWIVGAVTGNEEVPRLSRSRGPRVMDDSFRQRVLDVFFEFPPILLQERIIGRDGDGYIEFELGDDQTIIRRTDGGEEGEQILLSLSGDGQTRGLSQLFPESFLQFLGFVLFLRKASEGIETGFCDFPEALVIESDEEYKEDPRECPAKAHNIQEKERSPAVFPWFPPSSRDPHGLLEEYPKLFGSANEFLRQFLHSHFPFFKTPLILPLPFAEDVLRETNGQYSCGADVCADGGDSLSNIILR